MITESVVQAINEMKFDPKTLSDLTKFPSFEDRMEWVEKNLRFLGQGSSRSAYILDSKRVLKLAINHKGIAQNETEIEVATDPKQKQIYAKIFQYDPKYKWLVSELVRELNSQDEFHQLTGVEWRYFENIVEMSFGLKGSRNWQEYVYLIRNHLKYYEGFTDNEAEEYIEKLISNKWFFNAMESLKNSSLLGGDIAIIEHWGKTPDQRVVLLDYGYTKAVRSQFYV